jgi:glycerol uptake facilitator-like aquaporin
MEASVPESHTFGHLLRACFFEFFGTAMTVYAFNFMSTDYMGRGFAYFVGWMIAVSVSGAHFNPATTLAVYIAEGKYMRQILRLILYYVVQFLGAYLGILMVYLIFNSPVNGYLLWPQTQNPEARIWFFSELGNIYYAKIAFLEFLNTFTFVLVYLFVIYKPALRTVDEIIKGLAVSITLWVCYWLCAGSGACLNPALGLAQTTY